MMQSLMENLSPSRSPTPAPHMQDIVTHFLLSRRALKPLCSALDMYLFLELVFPSYPSAVQYPKEMQFPRQTVLFSDVTDSIILH